LWLGLFDSHCCRHCRKVSFVGVIVHRRSKLLLSMRVSFAAGCLYIFGSGASASASASTDGISRGIFDHELASIELVVLGVNQSGSRVLDARKIDKSEPVISLPSQQ
jgi:hypothetical protein